VTHQRTISPVPDRHQNFWQLASIQGASQSIIAAMLGGQLSKQYGAGTALVAICIGNFILWIIGLTIISMAAKDRKNAIENVYKSIGKVSGFALSIILVIAFLSWYMLDLQATTVALSNFFLHNQDEKNVMIRLGAVLGLIIALVSTGGIRFIKHACVVVFPFLLFFVIYTLSTGDWSSLSKSNWEFSFPATISVITLTLPGTVNLPTFFRHSRSIADSILALTLITLIYILFQSFSIFTEVASPSEFLTKNVTSIASQTYLFLGLIFVVGSLFCLNLVNIYYASAAWELIVPHKRSPKEYAIIGLLGTAAYTFFQVDFPMRFLESIASNLIASIGIALFVVRLIDITFKHLPRPYEKMVNTFCWSIGCIVAIITQINQPTEPDKALIAGCSASLLAFLTIIVCEETTWAIRKLSAKKMSNVRQQ